MCSAYQENDTLHSQKRLQNEHGCLADVARLDHSSNVHLPIWVLSLECIKVIALNGAPRSIDFMSDRRYGRMM